MKKPTSKTTQPRTSRTTSALTRISIEEQRDMLADACRRIVDMSTAWRLDDCDRAPEDVIDDMAAVADDAIAETGVRP